MTGQPDFTVFWLPLLLPVLLVLAVYRLTRLVVKDDFPPVLWVRDRLAGGWRPLTSREWEIIRSNRFDPGKPGGSKPNPFQMRDIDETASRWVERARWSPHWLAELMTCPWCASGWLSGAVVAATDLTVGLPVPWLYGVAVWGAAAPLASREWA